MSESSNPRPTQATLAGWLTVSASVFLVASLFSSIGSLRSLENRRTWEEALAEPGLGALGLGVDDLLTLLYVLSLVAAACATATAVLGVFALRGDRQARLALSILAVPLFLAGFLTGGLLSAVVAVSVVMMWLQPSRDWFAGRQPAPRPEPPQAPARPDEPGPPTHQTPSADAPAPGAPQPWGRPSAEPTPGRAYEGYGGAGPATLADDRTADGPTAAPVAYPADPWARPAPTGGAATGPRPLGVVFACLSTWVFSALMIVIFGVGIAIAALDPQDLLDEVLAQDPSLADAPGATTGFVIGATAVMGGIFIVWAIAAMVLAAFAFRGANGARIALVVSAAVVAVPGLLLVLLAPLLAPVVLAAAVTIVGLVRADAKAWYAARSSSRRPSTGPPGAPGPWT